MIGYLCFSIKTNPVTPLRSIAQRAASLRNHHRLRSYKHTTTQTSTPQVSSQKNRSGTPTAKQLPATTMPCNRTHREMSTATNMPCKNTQVQESSTGTNMPFENTQVQESSTATDMPFKNTPDKSTTNSLVQQFSLKEGGAEVQDELPW